MYNKINKLSKSSGDKFLCYNKVEINIRSLKII